MNDQENKWSRCTSYESRWLEISSVSSPYQPQSLLIKSGKIIQC